LTKDLIIVGGGPAGSTCARKAAHLGLDVLLIEKENHPRRKECAGGFRPDLPNLLDFDISQTIEHEACGTHVYAPSGLKVICTKPMLTGYTVKRSIFDHFLLKKAEEAGAEIVSNLKVTKLEEGKDNIKVVTENNKSFLAKYVVGADGVNSIVAKSSGIQPHWNRKEIGLCMEARVPMDPSEIMRICKGPYESKRICIQIFFGGVKHGYAWCFPKQDEVSLGMGCLMPYVSDLKNAWKKFIEYFEKLNSVKVDLSHESAMRIPLAGPINQTISNRVMLVGDAGGFVSAATGEGIYYAIITGKLAAETTYEIIHNNKKTIDYELKWRNEIGKELKISNSLSQLMFHSNKNTEMIINLANKDTVIRDCMTELIGGLRSYSDIKKSLMKRVIARHTLTGLKLIL
jgi:geranylgeranyl reductase family protein